MSTVASTSASEDAAVSVVIVTWNVAREVLACLASLAGDGAVHDVTVIDNASHDGTVEAIRRSFPQVRVLANDANAGFARACNQGIRHTRGAYVLLLNPDCVPAAGAIARLADYMRRHGQAGAVGPRVRQPDGRDDLRSPCRLPTLWSDLCDRSGMAAACPTSRLWAAHRLPGWDRARSGAVDGVSGACLLLRRAALDAVGLLDEGFFLFGEDADLCLRVRQGGWQVHFCGEAAVIHQGGASTGQVRPAAAIHALISRQRFFRKHRGEGYALAHRLANIALAGAKALLVAAPALASAELRRTLALQWRILRWCATGRVDYEGSQHEGS